MTMVDGHDLLRFQCHFFGPFNFGLIEDEDVSFESDHFVGPPLVSQISILVANPMIPTMQARAKTMNMTTM